MIRIVSKICFAVKLRYFIGMTGEEVAEALGLSLATVNRDWAYARAWMYNEINRD